MFGWWHLRQLHDAAAKNDVMTIQRLLQTAKVDLNARRSHGSVQLTPLHVAIKNRASDAMRFLLDNGGDLNATFTESYAFSTVHWLGKTEYERDWTSLHLAVEIADIDTVQYLHSRGLSVEVRTSLGRSPLHYCAHITRELSYASHREHLRILRLLLTLRSDPNARDTHDRTPLFYASNGHGSAEAIAMLLDAGARVNAQDAAGQTALFWADGDGVVELLLQRGADPKVRDKHGWTAQDCAELAGIHRSKVELLDGLHEE